MWPATKHVDHHRMQLAATREQIDALCMCMHMCDDIIVHMQAAGLAAGPARRTHVRGAHVHRTAACARARQQSSCMHMHAMRERYMTIYIYTHDADDNGMVVVPNVQLSLL